MFYSVKILQDISYFSVLVIVSEVLPKEKKQKEEKFSLLGQCTADLMPLLQGSSFSVLLSHTCYIIMLYNYHCHNCYQTVCYLTPQSIR